MRAKCALNLLCLVLFATDGRASDPSSAIPKACISEECEAEANEAEIASILQTRMHIAQKAQTSDEDEGSLAGSSASDGLDVLQHNNTEAGRRRRRRRRRKIAGFNVKKKFKKMRRKAQKAARDPVREVKSASSSTISQILKSVPSSSQLKKLGTNALATADAIGDRLSSLAARFGEDTLTAVKSLGALVLSTVDSVGDAFNAALDALTSLFEFSCFDMKVMMCRAILPSSVFDCAAGSGVSMTIGAEPMATLTMVPKGLSKLFSLKTSSTAFVNTEGVPLGGISARSSTFPDLTSLLMPVSGLPIQVAVDAALEFLPTITVDIKPTIPSAAIRVSGLLFAQLNALVVATSSASYTKKLVFPRKPITLKACSGFFCVLINLQARATLSTLVTALGSAGISSMGQLQVDATVEVNLATGEMSQSLSLGAPEHEEELDMDASFSGSVKISIGPILTIMPLPGAPVNFEPTLSLEMKTHSEAVDDSWTDGTGLNDVDTCAAAALNFHADTSIKALGITSDLSFSTSDIQTSFIEGLAEVPINLVNAIEETISECLGGASAAVVSGITAPIKAAAKTMTEATSSLVPSLDFSLPSPFSLLDATTCETLATDNLPEGGTCGTTPLTC